MAKTNNPQYLHQRQNILEAERNVNKTRVESRLNASVNASIGFNQVAETFKGTYSNPLHQELASVSISIPLVDWRVRKGKYNMAKNNLNVAKIAARQEEINLEEEVSMTINDFIIQKRMIASAEEALELAEIAYKIRLFISRKCTKFGIDTKMNKKLTSKSKLNFHNSLLATSHTRSGTRKIHVSAYVTASWLLTILPSEVSLSLPLN
jgi:hypothetical protein